MLKAKLDFEMQDLLTTADKSEMARFNNAGMNWTNTNFMELFTFNFVERITHYFICQIMPVIRVTQGFQPGMIFILQPGFFMNFPFKCMKGKIAAGKGRIRLVWIGHC